MKGFQFRLEPVLSVREFSLERARLHLAESVTAWEHAKAEESKAADAAAATERTIATRLREGVEASEVRAVASALVDQRLGLQRARELVATAQVRVDEARAAVCSAHAALRSIEILREKAFAAWQVEWRRHEQRELDEIAVERARRSAEARP
jgi:flagellar export protein FliJ